MANDIAELQQGIASIRDLVQSRYDPVKQAVDLLQEENKRMQASITQMLGQQRQTRRSALLGGIQGAGAVVPSGKYRGCSPLDLAIIGSILDGAERNNRDLKPGMLAEWRENFNGAKRAMDSDTTGSGDELTFEGLSTELWADVHLQTAIASLFRRIDMPTNPFRIPLDLGDINWYPGTPNTAGTSTDALTDDQTLTAKELVGVIAWSYNLDEDAVIAMLPQFRALLTRNAAEVLDDVILNADTTVSNGINSDGATIAASDTDGVAQWLLGWDGLRHIPLVDNTAQGNDHNAVLTLTSMADFTEIRGFLGKYGVNPNDLAYIVDIPLYIQMMAIADIATLDKYGPSATVLTGEVAKIGGVPVIVSEVMRETDDDGKVTDPASDSNNDNSGILVVNRTQYTVGYVRDLMIETERDIQKRQTVMVASMRVAFNGRNDNASDSAVALQYNIT